MMRARVLACVALVCTIAACSVRDDAASPSHFTARAGAIVPPDVLPSTGMRGGSTIDGLHVEDGMDATTALCCWIDARAEVVVSKRSSEDELRVGGYVPDAKGASREPQRWRILGPNGVALMSASFSPGMNVAKAAVPERIARLSGPIHLTLDVSGAKAPIAARDAAILVSIYFTRTR